jgi:hypothetical protein
MKKYIAYTVVAFFAAAVVAIAAPDKEKAIAREKDAWQTFKDKKADEFRKHLAADFRGVYGDGIYNLAKQMEDLQKMELKSFALSDFDVVFPDADTVILTYKVTMQAMRDGKDFSGDYNSGSVWRKSKDAWHAVYHSNVVQQKDGAPATQ